MSPLARRTAADLGVDLATVDGSGPRGAVVAADVERADHRATDGHLGARFLAAVDERLQHPEDL